MGCFNVVCSVSNLSIGHGTRVAFLPLTPNAYEEVHQIDPSSSLIYPNCYFNPFSLPIFGEYNDYGSLENIEEDENTKAIEAFFGISIQEFIAILTCDRDITDHFGELFKTYANHRSLMSDYQVQLDEAFLTKLGFTKTEDSFYVFENFPIYVNLTEDGYELFDAQKELVCKNSGYDAKSKFIQDFEKKTDYILLVSKENQGRVKRIRTLSGMFIHADIYKELVDFNLKEATLANGYVTEKVLEKWGFILKEETKEGKLYQKEKNAPFVQKERNEVRILEKDGKAINKYIFRLKEFVKVWEKVTAETLDIETFYDIHTYDIAFDEFKEWLNKQATKEDPILQKAKEALKDPTLTEEVRKGLIDFIATLEDSEMDKFEIDRHEYGRFFEEWEHFHDLYIPLIKEGKCKEAFKSYKAFYSSLYSCNRFFFPGMNGEQHGNLEASKMLLEKSLDIVNQALEKRDY